MGVSDDGGDVVIFNRHKTEMPDAAGALPGRDSVPFEVPDQHAVLGTRIQPPFPEGLETAVFGMGCFWGAERLFWTLDGVYSTAAGYAGGHTRHPTYEETCSGETGFGEVVASTGYGKITTEIAEAGPFYFAEEYHQQYLHKNPGGYCNHGPNGMS